MNKKTAAQIIHDHTTNQTSYRSLGKKYGVDYSSIYRLVKSKEKKQQEIIEPKAVAEAPLPDDVKTLKEALRKALLKIELQDLMIDISSKELGVDLRKKHGARQSK